MFIFSFSTLYPFFHREGSRKKFRGRTAHCRAVVPTSRTELVLGHATGHTFSPHPPAVALPFWPYSYYYMKARIYLQVRITLLLSYFSYILVFFFTIRNLRALIFFCPLPPFFPRKAPCTIQHGAVRCIEAYEKVSMEERISRKSRLQSLDRGAGSRSHLFQGCCLVLRRLYSVSKWGCLWVNKLETVGCSPRGMPGMTEDNHADPQSNYWSFGNSPKYEGSLTNMQHVSKTLEK
jgi:hypothetical protein